MLKVHLVFDQLDDGQEKVGVAEPAEHIFEDREVGVLHSGPDAVAERREHHDGYVLVTFFQSAGDVKHIVVVGSWHTDDEVDAVFEHRLLGHLERRDLYESRWEAKSQSGIFKENLLIDTTIVFEHKRIVRVGKDKDIANPALHQIDKVSIAESWSLNGLHIAYYMNILTANI